MKPAEDPALLFTLPFVPFELEDTDVGAVPIAPAPSSPAVISAAPIEPRHPIRLYDLRSDVT